MSENEQIKRRPARVGTYSLILALCWSCTVVTSLVWNIYLQKNEIYEIALNIARTYLENDNRYRRWNASQGGVYLPLPVDESGRVLNFDIPEHYVSTPSGRILTLTDHSTMMKQVYELAARESEVKSRSASLDPLGPQSVADAWETEALMSFERGSDEAADTVTVDGKEYIRLMRPFYIEEGCLSCHGQQGYKIGDIRGGISVMLPMELIGTVHQNQMKILWWGHFLWWLLGLSGIGLSYVGMRRRISERERAEEISEKLKRQQERILGAAGEGIYGADNNGALTFMNPASAKMLGLEPAAVLGQQTHGLWHHSKSDGSPYPVEECLVYSSSRDGKVYQVAEEVFWRKDGTCFPVEYTSTPIVEDGKIFGSVVVFTDITERKKAEEEMARIRQHLQNILDSMPSVLAGVDINGNITLWNREAEKITGLGAGDVRGRALRDLFPVLFAQLDSIKTIIAEQKPVKIEGVLNSVGEEVHFSDIMIFPVLVGSSSGAVIRIDDVTDRVLMEDKLLQAEKMSTVAGLVEGIAHEINNPLGGMMQGAQSVLRRMSPAMDKNVEVAADCGIDLEKVQSYMEKRGIFQFLEGIRNAGQRAADIVSYMLQFSRSSEATMVAVSLGELIDRSLELITSDHEFMERFAFAQIEIIREYEDEMPKVPCLVTEIEQVLLNLIKNAAQAMDGWQERRQASPRIILRVKSEEGMARIEVEDNGPGMDENVLKHIFEPFFTTKPPGSGIGLGLSVSYFIITTGHLGQMNVESSPGLGARFVIRLPRGRKQL